MLSDEDTRTKDLKKLEGQGLLNYPDCCYEAGCKAQLQAVVDDLRERADKAKKRAIRDRELGLEQTSELESVKAVHFRDLADTYEKELKGGSDIAK